MKLLPALCAVVAVLTVCPALRAADSAPLSSLDLQRAQQDWGKAQANHSVEGHPLTVGGKVYAEGFGTHANSSLHVALSGRATRFKAAVGVDDEVGAQSGAEVEFEVVADGKSLWRSGAMRPGDAARAIDLDLTGKDVLTLLVKAAGSTVNFDHADWVDTGVQYTGAPPQTIDTPTEAAVILTPKPAAAPRLNCPRVFGVRPGSPFLFTAAATGERPLQFSADGLPPGLKLDETTGQITGSLAEPGEHRVTLRASNRHGKAERPLRIVVGEQIALTPPMGWNSWNCWAGAVDQDKVLRSARALVSSGLSQHGWSYVNIDDTWQGNRTPPSDALQANGKFPDMAGLCAQLHAMGLRAGIYSTPWVTSYGGYHGGSADQDPGAVADKAPKKDGHRFGAMPFARQDAKQWGDWGFDYLKYDWNPNDVPHVQEMADALRASGRDIAFSLSNSAPFEHAADWARLSNCWRTTGDINDRPGSMEGIGFAQERWAPFTGPGHWNDPDMLVVGYVGWGPKLHPTHLSPNEQYTHLSLWCLLSAPLLIGCDLERLDDFTLGLLTNDEVLEVDQDPLGQPAKWAHLPGPLTIISKPLEDGSLAVGLFNRLPAEEVATVKWSDLGLSGRQTVRDLWRQQDLDAADSQYEGKVPPLGVVFLRVAPAK